MKRGILFSLGLLLCAGVLQAQDYQPPEGLRHAVVCPPFKGAKDLATRYHDALIEALKKTAHVDVLDAARKHPPHYTYRIEGQLLPSSLPDGDPLLVLTMMDLARREEIASYISPITESGLNQWVRNTLDAITSKMAILPFECRLTRTRVQQASFSLDRGLSAGLQPGMVLRVAEAEDDLISPESGMVVGRNAPHAFGQIRIFRVEENNAYARPVEGTVFPRGRGLRFVARGF